MIESSKSDLSRLNGPERRVLDLLAEGHTAKSIATLLECSVGAVNERLREARRKTGVGSSRELARMVRSQKKWDKEIGVDQPWAKDSFLLADEADDGRWSMRTGLIMALVFAATLAIGTLAFTHSGSLSDTRPPTQVQSSGPANDSVLEARRNMLLQEKRDDGWASTTENALRGLYGDILELDAPLLITCRLTMCEVTGTISEGPPDKGKEKLVDNLQSDSTLAAQAKLGLKQSDFALEIEDVSQSLKFRAYLYRVPD